MLSQTCLAPVSSSRLVSLPVRISARRQAVRMGSNQSNVTVEEFAAGARKSFKLDASANGCTGMFWRSKPDMGASVSAPDWPRNGAVLQGWLSKQHDGWVRIDHPKEYWLPTHQYGKQILFWDN